MPSVDDYINRIKRDDPHLTSLNLANKKLTDADLTPLFKAFDAKPEVRNRIKVIFLNGNNIQYLRLFGFRKLVLLHVANCGIEELAVAGLVNLTTLYAANNKLSNLPWESLKKLQVVSLIGNNIISARISALPNLRCIDITTNKLSFASTIAVNAMRQKLPNATIKTSMPRFMPQLDSMLLFLHFSRVVQQLFKTKRSFEILFNLLLMFSPDKNSKGPKIPFDIINMIVAYLLPFNIERVIERELGNFRTSFAARNGRENQSNAVFNQILTSFVSSQLSVPKLVEVAKLKAVSDLSNEMQEVRALRINRQRVAIATEETDIENQRLTRPLLSG